MNLLKKTAIAAALAAGLAAVPSQASAAWACAAQSRTGSWGVGASYSLGMAKRIALHQCAINTPYGYRCRIVRCQ